MSEKFPSKKSSRPEDNASDRLAFLEDFMRFHNIDTAEMAEILEITRPACYHILQKAKDTTLSYIEKILAARGFVMDLFLTREIEEVTQSSKIPIDVSNYVTLPGEFYKPNRLAFLEIALKRYGIKHIELAEMMNMNISSITKTFQRDDLTMSRLHQFCDAANMTLFIKIRPEKEGDIPTIVGDRKCRIVQMQYCRIDDFTTPKIEEKAKPNLLKKKN